jgi:twitching motility protein PilT
VAQLDPLLNALKQRNADELSLREGEKPAFGDSTGLKPVSPKVLSKGQIIALLSEIAGPLDAAKMKGGEPIRFSYEMTGGERFDCETETAGTFSATVRPSQVAVAAAVSEQPAVSAQAVAPVPAAAPVSAVQPAPMQLEEEADGADETENNEITTAPISVSSDPIAKVPAMAVDPAVRDVESIAPARGAAEQVHCQQLEGYLRRMFELDASDLHLSADETPMIRLHGEMKRLEGERPINANHTRLLLESIMPPRNRTEFVETNDTDFAYEIPGVARFRVNVFTDRRGAGGVFRTIPTEILTAEQLQLPPAILDLCNLSKGLVLVTGPTGSGKSTTLAAMIDYINKTRSDHIITIEDPIEFVHPNHKCLINQREVTTHTDSFKKALRAALREDPDIVLVGELRDLETIAIAIETAETGHLVFGTLHTTTAISTVDRVIDQFPADRQAQIRTMLSESLRGVVAQTLLKKISGGRVAALEVLIANSAIANLIREGKTFQIPSLMQTGKKQGMQMLNDVLIDMAKKKIVDPDEAYRKAVDKASFLSSARSQNLKIASVSDPKRPA